MLTKEQEQFLADFASKGIADNTEIENRNKQIKLDAAIQVVRAEKKAELEVQAQKLIDAGIQDFETNIVPSIKVPDEG